MSAPVPDPTVPLFSPEEALARVGDDADLLAEMLGIFLEEGPSQLAAVSAALDARDAAQLGRTAHGLKGALLSIGAEGVAPYAKGLEQLGRNGSLDGAAELLHTLRSVFGRLLDEVNAWIAARG